jgi:hypothetical protein
VSDIDDGDKVETAFVFNLLRGTKNAEEKEWRVSELRKENKVLVGIVFERFFLNLIVAV